MNAKFHAFLNDQSIIKKLKFVEVKIARLDHVLL